MADDKLSGYMMASELADAVDAGKVVVNWNGHYASGTKGTTPRCHDPKYVINKVRSAIRMTLEDDQIARLHAAWKAGEPLAEPLEVGPDYLEDCWECGQELVILTDGVTWAVKEKCPHPAGIKSMKFDLNVPSGKMVVANDLRYLFPVLSDHNVNQPHGVLLTTQDYAKIGLIHCNVGNTCPAMFECRDGKRPADTHFVIGTASSKKKNPRFNSGDKAFRVAGISTDLWWYSICDADEFVKRTGKPLEKSLEDYDATVVPCVPGVYEFRHIYHMLREKRDDFSQPHVYTYIKWKKNPGPVVDYMAAYRGLNLTAEQVVADKIKQWPSLYAERFDHTTCKKAKLTPDEQYARVADSLLMVIGGGNSYHPNGFWGGESWMTNDSPAVEPVVLDKPYHWYPGSENYCALSHIAGLSKEKKVRDDLAVNDSFIALAFNVCRCILTHGVTDYQPEERSHSKSTFAFAKRAMAALKKKYPDKIPANCVDIKETDKPYVHRPL